MAQKVPVVARITPEQSHAVLGLMVLLIVRRNEQVASEKAAASYLESIGAVDSEDGHWRVIDAVQEASWNEGDSAPEAAKALLESLGLEVVDAED